MEIRTKKSRLTRKIFDQPIYQIRIIEKNGGLFEPRESTIEFGYLIENIPKKHITIFQNARINEFEIYVNGTKKTIPYSKIFSY
jgi:hypothetical protein